MIGVGLDSLSRYAPTGLRKALKTNRRSPAAPEENFQAMDESSKGKKRVGMEGLVRERLGSHGRSL